MVWKLNRDFIYFRDDYDSTVDRVHTSLFGFFILIRSFVLFHFCSKVNEDSQKSLKVLRDAPMENWTIDVMFKQFPLCYN